jgi:hypothetical protein
VQPPKRLWQPWDDWSPYAHWQYGHATPEDDDFRLMDLDTFWPDELIRDQFLNTEEHALQRECMGIPPIPASQPQAGLSDSQPRHSSCDKRPVVHPDNVYGSQNPTQSEQISNREFREIIEGVPAPSGSGNRPDSPPHEGKNKQCADYLVKMVQEGGAGLTNFLLSAAVSSAPAKGKIPDVTKVCEWHFRDLMRLPKAAQEE